MTGGGILAFLTALFGLGLELFREYFSAQARARKNNEQFQIDQKKFNELVQSVLNRQQQADAKDSADADNAWEIADEKIRKTEGAKDAGSQLPGSSG